jgi:parvulin-like peptidyl-prolyl isomerase
MEKLNEIFNIEEHKKDVPILVSDDVEDDYALARRTLREVITKGSSALDDALMLARSSEHPRAYEVTGQIMKTVSDVAKDLLSLQKQKQDIDKPSKDATPQIGQQNNIVFAGSTEDLLRMIKQQDVKTIDSN